MTGTHMICNVLNRMVSFRIYLSQ